MKKKGENAQPLLGHGNAHIHAGGGFAVAPTFATPTAHRRNEMLRAAQSRDSTRLRWLINQCLSEYTPNELDEVFALHLAAWMGDLNDVVESLLKAKANPYTQDMNGDSALHYAVRACNTKILKYFYKRLGDEIFALLNNKQFNLLLTAAAETPDDHTYEVLQLLEWLYLRGCSIESQDCTGKTPLLHAAQRGSIVLVQWFLSRCANLGHRDHMGRTAMHLACTTGDEETALCLSEKGAIAFVHCKSNDDAGVNTPLKICWNRGFYMLGLSLRQWEIQKAIYGTCALFSNSYAWYYQTLSFANAILFSLVFRRLLTIDWNAYLPFACVWASLWAMSALCWFIAFFSNPGFAKKNIIPSQTHRCSSDFRRDVFAKWMSVEGNRTAALEKLYAIEREQMKIGYDLYSLNQAYGVSVHDDNVPAEIQQRYNRNAAQLQKYRDQIIRIVNLISKARQEAVPSVYREAVLGEGLLRKLCISCRIIKPFRAHHCSDCAHCVNRFDHHCIWLDNCVGINNQRSFYCFLLFVGLSLLYIWLVIGLFFHGVLSHRPPDQHPVATVLLEPLGYFLIANGVFNVLWFGFVSYLLARTTKAMVTNLTFYEYLKKPVHVMRRFGGRTKGYMWDFADTTPAKLARNAFGFCALRDDWDHEDYPTEVAEYKSLLAAEKRGATGVQLAATGTSPTSAKATKKKGRPVPGGGRRNER